MTLPEATRYKDFLGYVEQAYSNWNGLQTPDFLEQEIIYKQSASQLAQTELSLAEFDRLLQAGALDEINGRLQKIAQATNLLYLSTPQTGDLALLNITLPDPHQFYTQLRNLLYGAGKSPQRIQHFSDYLQAHNLPSKWTFSTYYLFLCHPDQALFVKPTVMQWFLRYMGESGAVVRGAPTGAQYQTLLHHAQTVKEWFNADNMIQVQSLIWVVTEQIKTVIGYLPDPADQIVFGFPRAEEAEEIDYDSQPTSQLIKESHSVKIPSYYELIQPVFSTMKELGGRVTNKQLVKAVADRENFSEEQREIRHTLKGNDNRTKLAYRIAWSKTYLKNYGVLNDVSRGVWELTDKGLMLETVDADEVVRFVRSQRNDPYEDDELDKIDEFEIDADLLEDGDEVEIVVQPTYSLAQMAEETGFTEETLAQWVHAIKRKGQGVFYGPPGTGKTFIAQKLAQHLIGGGDGVSELVQFHPAYAYEDFMQGLRPKVQDGVVQYKLVNGRFLTFCNQAQDRDTSVLIIDEINRANLASVFGELMYLLEYRDSEIPLAGGGKFHIPQNVIIIGTMNTADRSIALVDHALRRRFAFIHLLPNLEALRHYHQEQVYDIEPLITLLAQINEKIDDSHYYLGTTFFMVDGLQTHLPAIWQMEIEPYLQEYFFANVAQVHAYRWQAVKERLGF